MNIQRIAVPTDFSEDAHEALRYAAVLARAEGAALSVVHIVETFPFVAERNKHDAHSLVEREVQAAREHIQRDIEPFAAQQVVIEPVVLTGKPKRELLRFLQHHDIDLVVLGTHGHGLIERMIWGSVTEHLMRTSPCPTLTINTALTRRSAEHLRHILVPTDFSGHSERAWQYALKLGQRRSSTLHLVHVIEPMVMVNEFSTVPVADDEEHDAKAREGARDLLAPFVAEAEELGLAVQTAVLKGYTDIELALYMRQHNIDLVCVGAYGKRGFEKFVLGSTTERVLKASLCPVLVVRPPTNS